LLLHPLLFCIYALTLSTMYFTYVAILIAILVIAIINIQPHKMAFTFFSSTDLILLLLLTFLFVSLNGRVLAYSGKYLNSNHVILSGLTLFSLLIPLLYIVYFILSWFTVRISIRYKSKISTFRNIYRSICSRLTSK
jgi:hypothetical protein